MAYMVFRGLRFGQYLPLHRMHLITDSNGSKFVVGPTLVALVRQWHLWVEGEVGIFELFETRLVYFL